MRIGERSRRGRGFTLLELMLVLAVAAVLTAIALNPIRTYMASWDAHTTVKNVAGQIALARMRAASNFSWAQVYCDTTVVPQTCQVRVNNPGSNSTSFDNEKLRTGGYGGWGAQPLARTTTLVPTGGSVGGISTGVGGQSGGSPTPYTTISFNSRGMPIDPSNLTLLKSDYAMYLSSNTGTYYAISVDLSGRPRQWVWTGNQWSETDTVEQ